MKLELNEKQTEVLKEMLKGHLDSYLAKKRMYGVHEIDTQYADTAASIYEALITQLEQE